MKSAIVLLVITLLSLIFIGCKSKAKEDTKTEANNLAVTATFPEGSSEARGQELFVSKGRCSSCHSLAEDTRIVGPSLAHIGTVAGERVAGFDAKSYLLQSVLQPDAFKPEGYESLQMDSSLAKTLTSEELDDIVAYLLTLE